MQEEDVLSVDFKILFRILWREKWLIIGITLLAGLFGLIYANNIREEFVSQGKILPEAQGKGSSLGQISGLAALAGVDLGSMGGGVDAIRPDLYPEVLESTPFFIELLKATVTTKDNKRINFEKYYNLAIEENKIPSEKLLHKYHVKEEGIIIINGLNEIRLKDLRKRVTSSIDKKSGVVTIVSKMPDPVVAAEVSRFAMNYVIDYIRNYRTEKLRTEVNYLANQLEGSKGKYYSSQKKKAAYADQHQMGSIVLQSSDIQRERLESEYKMSSTVYNEILKRYEEAKFRLSQETPVFNVLEPPVTPFLKNEPQKGVILFVSLILGSCIGLVFTLLKSENYRLIIG